MEKILAAFQWIIAVMVFPIMFSLYTTLNRRISYKENKDMCVEKHNNLKTRLDKDDILFEKIDRKLDVIQASIVRLDTTLKMNGNKNE